MLRLYGFPVSNYYNKIKLALLEKGIPFEESLVYPSGEAAFVAQSPMGKVPFIVDGELVLSESQAIAEYLEEAYPRTPLYPRDPGRAAKVRELVQVIELYLELVARRVFAEAFFGGTVTDEVKREVSVQLVKGAAALGRLARFEPFIAGPEFSHADCAALVHLPVVSAAGRTVFGVDVFGEVPGVVEYLKHVRARPAAQAVEADRRAGLEAFMARRKRDTGEI
ncbi:MAG: glutathione S-transferase [Burkholderiales bacterium]